MTLDSEPFVKEKIESDNTIKYTIVDHLGGFDINLNNRILDELTCIADNSLKTIVMQHDNILSDTVKAKYNQVQIKFDAQLQNKRLLEQFQTYNLLHDKHCKNFLCCFNGSGHVSRQFLISIIDKLGWWDDNYCTKNFQFSWDIIDGNLSTYLDNKQETVYRKFFINQDSDINQRTVDVHYEHCKNLTNLKYLESRIIESFVFVAGESMATSYHPSISEKFLNGVVTKSLFVVYGQPGWHQHLEHYYGFKLYENIFDYSFDSISNPVLRLVRLMEMLSKFSALSTSDWHDLYYVEQDTIDYNYEHYFSGDYLKHLAQFDQM